MAGPLLKDSVSETSTTTGTGSYTLAGARTGYSAFSAALANGDTCHYVARDTTGGGWEVGLGTWATGNTLARTRVIRSSNANAAVSWAAGTREVSLTQPVAAIAGPVVNVRGYGATGDGTTDDTAAVAAALADCPAGGTVYFPAGTYSLATWTAVALTKKVRLQGDGPTTSVLTGPDITTNDFVSTTKDIRASDLGFSTFRRVFDLSPVATYLTDVQFENLRLENFNKGLYGKNTTVGAGVQNLRITGCELYDATDSLIYFDFPHMEDCLIADNYGEGAVNRFVHLDSNNVTYVRGRYVVRNNNFRTLYNPAAVGSAIGIIVYGSRATITGNVLQDITNVEETDCNGIYTKCRFFTISDNVLIDAAMSEGAINVKGTDRSLPETTSPWGYGGVVQGNVIWFTAGEATRCGLKIATNDVLCQGNYLEGCGDVGIYTDSKRLDNIMIRDNLIVKTKGAYGISLHGGGRGVKVVGNTIAGVSGENDPAALNAGIRVSKNGGADLEISDNNISDVADNGTGGTGIRVSSTVAMSRIRISRNRITTTMRTFADGATTNGSPTLTSAALGLFDQLDVGQFVSGTGIPAGTKITAVASTTSATMSANATATASGVSVTIGQMIPRGISFTTTVPDDVFLFDNVYTGATTPTYFSVTPTNFREVRSEPGGLALTFYDNTGAATSLYPTDGSAVTASLRTLGSGANQALPGNTVTGGAGGIGVYGDGSDGTTTLDGTATITWGSKSGSTYSMTRDAFLDSLTINTGVTLKTNSYRLYVRSTLTVTGALHNNGNAGSGATGGASVTAQTCGSGGPGTSGGTGAGAAPASSQTNSLGSDGGAGGAGSGGAGGAGQNASVPTSSAGRMHGLPQMALGKFLGSVYGVANGGAGGGAGGGDGTNAGGGGGAGGAVVVLVAAVIVNNGTISANGGAGAAGVAGNAGGGGGGGGGAVLITTSTPVTGSGTITASAGAAGAGSGTGSAGSAGTAGVTTTLTN